MPTVARNTPPAVGPSIRAALALAASSDVARGSASLPTNSPRFTRRTVFSAVQLIPFTNAATARCQIASRPLAESNISPVAIPRFSPIAARNTVRRCTRSANVASSGPHSPIGNIRNIDSMATINGEPDC